jgi:citrate synthase
MVTGEKPDPVSVQAMDLYLSLLADHDLNASTFTARVIVSTLSDIHAALAGAIGALKGPLHGGANEKAMEMFLEIGDPAKTEKWVEKAIAEKRKIMGFGHRVYKVEDPRSGLLKKMAERMGEVKKEPRWYQISVKVADTVHRLKGLNTNVDFYSASVLYLLGIPIDLFTTVFAVGRAAGWCAHVFEQLGDNRLIRPRSEYTGPVDRAFIPLETVIAGPAEHHQALLQYLEAREAAGELKFGHAIVNQSFVTCYVPQADKQINFLDGQGGGYIQAATELKLKLKR